MLIFKLGPEKWAFCWGAMGVPVSCSVGTCMSSSGGVSSVPAPQ